MGSRERVELVKTLTKPFFVEGQEMIQVGWGKPLSNGAWKVIPLRDGPDGDTNHPIYAVKP